jgi:hypothetical protein
VNESRDRLHRAANGWVAAAVLVGGLVASGPAALAVTTPVNPSTPPVPVPLRRGDGATMHWLLLGAALGLSALLFMTAILLLSRAWLARRSELRRRAGAVSTSPAARDGEG